MESKTNKKLCLGLLLSVLCFATGTNVVSAQAYDLHFEINNAPSPSYSNWGLATGSNTQAVSWSYYPADSAYICEVGAYIRKVNSPTDEVRIKIYSDAPAGLTSMPDENDIDQSGEATVVGISEVKDGADFSTSGDTITYFDLGGCSYMNANRTYYFVLERASLSDSHYYSIGYGTGTPNSDEGRSFGYVPTNSPDWTLDGTSKSVLLTGTEGYVVPAIITWEAPDFTDCTWISGTSTAETWYGRMAEDLTCGLEFVVKSGVEFAFYPSSSLEYVSQTLSTGKNTFPFSVIFGITDLIESSVATGTATGQSLTWTVAFPNGVSTTIDMLSPTTADDTFFGTTALKSWWYNLILYFAIAVLVYAIYSMIARGIGFHKKHKYQNINEHKRK